AVGKGPLQAGPDEHRGVVDALAAAGAAAADVNLVAVVLVVRHPVEVIEGRVVLLQGVVVVVPELLEALLLGGQALVAVGEDVPPRLVAAVGEAAPAGVGGTAAQAPQADDGGGEQGKPFHCDSFGRLAPVQFVGSGGSES